jgi:hypothetical protein
MDEKISLKAVDRYAHAFAQRIGQSFFNQKNKITGPEILQLSAVQQVNLFVLRDLLKRWQAETDKLKSPYFDYSAPAVREALTQFQNVLSNHILIARDDFMPLLTKAVSQTIYLILDPYDFYSDTLAEDNEQRTVHTATLKNEIRYIRINRAPLEKLVARLEEKKLSSVSGNEAFAILDQILEEVNFTPEEIDPYLQAFNEVEPVKPEIFFEAKPSPSPVPKIPPSPVAVNKEPAPAENINTLADNLAKQKIVRLKENLTINQKFMFTKVLFHGDFEIFSDAVEKIDRMNDLLEVYRFLEDAYPHWNKESDEYQEFIEILEKRFS